MNTEEFISLTLKKNTNSLKSTIFYINGIGALRTKEKVREAMRLQLPLMKKCKVTGMVTKANYQTSNWDTI